MQTRFPPHFILCFVKATLDLKRNILSSICHCKSGFNLGIHVGFVLSFSEQISFDTHMLCQVKLGNTTAVASSCPAPAAMESADQTTGVTALLVRPWIKKQLRKHHHLRCLHILCKHGHGANNQVGVCAEGSRIG